MKVKLLKRLRREIRYNAYVVGGFTAWMRTRLDGERYETGIHSGLYTILHEDELLLELEIVALTGYIERRRNNGTNKAI